MSNIVFAVPGLPNAFYGHAYVNDKPADNGTQVVAKINGVQVASTATSGGKYGYNPAFYVDDPNNDRSGSIIAFFINGVDTGQTAIFYSDSGLVREINLSATINSPPPAAPSGGGGGPSGGATVTQSAPPQQNNTPAQNNAPVPPIGPGPGPASQPQECNERWLCEDWSTCADGTQTRVCEDVNKCGTEDHKPMLTQPCSSQEQARALSAQGEAQAAGANGQQPAITGFAALAASLKEPRNIGILGLLAAGIVLALALRKGKKK